MAARGGKGTTGATKAPAAAKAPSVKRSRRPWLKSQVKVGQLVMALGDLGIVVDADELARAYNARGNRKVAKQNDPRWLAAQLEKVTGKAVLTVPKVHAVQSMDNLDALDAAIGEGAYHGPEGSIQ